MTNTNQKAFLLKKIPYHQKYLSESKGKANVIMFLSVNTQLNSL